MSADSSSVVFSPTTPTLAAGSTVTATIIARDARGNRIAYDPASLAAGAGAQVALTATTVATLTLTTSVVTVTAASCAGDASGAFVLTVTPTCPGTLTVTAALRGASLGAPRSYSVAAGAAPAAASSSVAWDVAQSQPLLAGVTASDAIVLSLRDAYGNPLAGMAWCTRELAATFAMELQAANGRFVRGAGRARRKSATGSGGRGQRQRKARRMRPLKLCNHHARPPTLPW